MNVQQKTGFTLIETLVAISILAISIVAPMTLAWQSLVSAFYARDQVTAFHLAQEALEAVRSVRDRNILRTLQGTPTDLLTGIPQNQSFTIDARDNTTSVCAGGQCEPLRHNGDLYGYGSGGSWVVTRFTRTVRAEPVQEDAIRVIADVRWRTGAFRERTFTISTVLYRWIDVEE